MTFPALINAIMLAVAVVGSTNFVLSPLLADIASDLGIATARSVLIPATCATALAVVAPLVGLGAQSVGRLPVMVGGLLCYGLAWVVAALTGSFAVMLGCAAVSGAAVGAVLPACYAAAAELSHEGDRARVMGRIVGGWALAFLSVLPFTFVAQWAGWRGALALLGGAALLLAGVLCLVPRPASAAAAGRTDLALVRRSVREVFGDRPTLMLLAVNLIDMGAFFGVYAYLGSEIRRVNGASVLAAGAVMSTYGLGLALITFNARWIDRFGRQRTAVTALVALGAVLTALPWGLDSPGWLALNNGLWGVVQGSVFTAMTALATEQLPHRRPVVTALLSCSTYLGVSLFTPGFVALYEQAGYRVLGFACGLACMAAGLLLSRAVVRDASAPRANMLRNLRN